MKARILKWKSCLFNDRYEVSNMGQVRVIKPYNNSKPVGYELRIQIDSRYGYAYVNLWQHSKPRRIYTHKLVITAFLGEPPQGMECCHKNGIRTDSRLSNLYYGTRSDNIRDAQKHGTFTQGFRKGYRHSEEVKAKIGAASKAQVWTKERCNKISIGRKKAWDKKRGI